MLNPISKEGFGFKKRSKTVPKIQIEGEIEEEDNRKNEEITEKETQDFEQSHDYSKDFILADDKPLQMKIEIGTIVTESDNLPQIKQKKLLRKSLKFFLSWKKTKN